MRKNFFGKDLLIFLAIFSIFNFFHIVVKNQKYPTCSAKWCNEEREYNSIYCSYHDSLYDITYSHLKPKKYYSNTSDSYSSEKKSSTSKSPSANSSDYYSYKGSGNPHGAYDSYDDGYDDVYSNDDYDYDRYENDSDYADGVDDALCEYDD